MDEINIYKRNKSQTVEEGMAIFFVNKNINDTKEKVYFEESLPDRYKKYANVAGSLIRLRNIVIILTFIEIGSAIWGFSYYFIRRSMLYVVINTLALILSILGVYSSIYLNEIGLIIYALLTTALPGTFFFYQLFELFAINNTAYDSDKRLNDNTLLFVFSMPYLYDFAVGIVTIILMSKIASFNAHLKSLRLGDQEAAKRLLEDEIDKIIDKYPYDYLQKAFDRRELEGMNCIICLENTRTVLIRPCNDILMCEPCSESLLSKSLFKIATCPKCRRPIEHFEKFYT